MQQLEATVFGHVQGVAFRYYASVQARRLGLVGWVANQIDGTVLTVAQGKTDDLQAYLEFLHTGSPAARVERVEAQFVTPTTAFSTFETRYI